jgi:imidazolonepropionase-like amidohydrolase
MWGDGKGQDADDGNEDTDPATPQLRAVDAVNPADRAFREALEAGVTTVVTGPGSANAVAGQMLALKTYGATIEDRIIRCPLAMKFALGKPINTYRQRGRDARHQNGHRGRDPRAMMKARRYPRTCRREEDDEVDPPIST